MITLYVDGKRVPWAEAEKLFAETAPTQSIEFRDAAGRIIATTVPAPAPDWESTITPEETARRLDGPFLTLEEYRKQADHP